MKNLFSKKRAAATNQQVFDGVSIKLLGVEEGEGRETVDVVELYDENGDVMVFEILAEAGYLGNKYQLITPYIEEALEDDENSEVFVMKEIFDKNHKSMLEPVEDEVLVNRIFSAFHKAGEDKFNFANTQSNSQQKLQTDKLKNEDEFFIADACKVSMKGNDFICPTSVIALDSYRQMPIWTIPSLAELFINAVITDSPDKLLNNEVCLLILGYSFHDTAKEPLFRVEQLGILGGEASGTKINLREMGVSLLCKVEYAKKNGWLRPEH